MTRIPLIHLSVALVLAGILAAGYVFEQLAITNASARAAELAGEIAAKEASFSGAANARSVLAELEANESFVRTRFVRPGDIVGFLEELEQSGRALGSTVTVTSVAQANKETITVALSIEGSFDAVMRTLGALEYGTHAVRTNSVTLDRSLEGSWRAVGTFELGADTTTDP